MNIRHTLCVTLTCFTLSMANAQQSSERFNRDLFLGPDIFQTAESAMEESTTEESFSDAVDDGEFTEMEILTKNYLRKVTEQLADQIEKTFFKKENAFWPSWDTSKEQVLIINQSADIAYLLNNQNKEIDSLGARIEYSARTFHDNAIKVNQFGFTEINGIKTYFYNVDTFTDLGEAIPAGSVYEEHLATLVHEAMHLLNQSDVKTADQIDYQDTMRGTHIKVDIATRYLRNEVHHHLVLALKQSDKKQQIQHVKNALYFHQKYLNQSSKNRGHNAYDYAEGSAEYATAIFVEATKDINRNFEQAHSAAKQQLLDNTYYIYLDDSGEGIGILDASREYYDIGAKAYFAAIELGHLDIIDTTLSPLSYLSNKYEPAKVQETAALKSTVYRYFQSQQDLITKQKNEIDRVMSDPNNILVELAGYSDGSMILESDSILFDYRGEEAAFEIRTQEVKFGDNRIKLDSQHLLMVYKDVPDQPENGQGQNSPIMVDGMSIDDPDFPWARMIIPVNKQDVDIHGDHLTIQTKHLLMFDVKFKKQGNHYKLIKS